MNEDLSSVPGQDATRLSDLCALAILLCVATIAAWSAITDRWLEGLRR